MPSNTQDKSKVELTPDQAQVMQRADLANIAKKLKAGKSLTRDERHIINAAASNDPIDSPALVNSYQDLAAVLGCHRQSLTNWRKLDGAPKPESNGKHVVDKWIKFCAANNLRGDNAEAPEEEQESDGLPSEARLKRQKLLLWCQEQELKLAQKRGELIEVDLVKEMWTEKVSGVISFLRKRLENELPSELEGLDAVDIHKELVGVVDELCELCHGEVS